MEKTNKESTYELSRKEEKVIKKMRRPLWLRVVNRIIGFSVVMLIAILGFHILFNAKAVIPESQPEVTEPSNGPKTTTSQNKEKTKVESKVKKIQEKTNKESKKIQKEYKTVQKNIEKETQEIENKFKANQEKIKEVQNQFPSLDLTNDSETTETEKATQDLYDQVDDTWQDEEEVSIE